VPDAAICYDRFHLVKNLNHIVDLVRREEWNRARREKDDRTARLIKGQRYNLLRRGTKNSPNQQSRLEELLVMNERLSKAYLLLEDFREALCEKHVGHTQRALEMWLATAAECGIQKIVAFARRIKDASRQIVNAIRYGLNNGRLEGFNNLIARILHRGCGYHDTKYLFLKLRQAALPTELQVPVFQKWLCALFGTAS
jgi:transposase